MSQWNHPMCRGCWVLHRSVPQPDGSVVVAEPYKVDLHYRAELSCCWCTNTTEEGIFVRDHPFGPPHCQGHPDDDTGDG